MAGVRQLSAVSSAGVTFSPRKEAPASLGLRRRVFELTPLAELSLVCVCIRQIWEGRSEKRQHQYDGIKTTTHALPSSYTLTDREALYQ